MDTTRLDRRLRRIIVSRLVLVVLISSLLLVGLALPISASSISYWAGYPVGTSYTTVRSVALGDLDGDDDPDIVSGHWEGYGMQVRAWRNSGSPFAGLWLSNDVGADLGRVRSVAVGDLDNDGYRDIVSTYEYDDPDPDIMPVYKVIAWKNDGSPFAGAWSSNEVGFPDGHAYSVALGDLDKDGYLDIVAGLYHNETIEYQVIAWENPGSPTTDPFTTPWITHTIGASLGDVHTVALADLDNDGYLDIVSGSGYAEDYEVIVWRNDQSPFDGPWSSNDVGAATDVWAVAVGDLDGDGFRDIVSTWEDPVTPGYKVIVWKNDGTPFSGYWMQNDVGAPADEGWSLAVGDLDYDGDLDIVSGSGLAEDYEVIAWGNDGSPFSGPWQQNDVGALADEGWSVAVGDLDDDGYLDIVSGSGYPSDFEVMAWRNIVYGVEVTPATGAKSGNPGQTVTYTLQVTNNGNTTDTFDVDVSGNVWTTSAPSTVGPLAAGESANMDVGVTIPTDAAGGATDVATVTVTSQGDNTQWDASELTTTANDVYGVEVTPATGAKSGNPGQTVTLLGVERYVKRRFNSRRGTRG